RQRAEERVELLRLLGADRALEVLGLGGLLVELPRVGAAYVAVLVVPDEREDAPLVLPLEMDELIDHALGLIGVVVAEMFRPGGLLVAGAVHEVARVDEVGVRLREPSLEGLRDAPEVLEVAVDVGRDDRPPRSRRDPEHVSVALDPRGLGGHARKSAPRRRLSQGARTRVSIPPLIRRRTRGC